MLSIIFKQTSLKVLLKGVLNSDFFKNPFLYQNDVNNTLFLQPNAVNSAYAYDAVMLVAKAFDKILKDDPNSTFDDPALIYSTIMNTSFTGIP